MRKVFLIILILSISPIIFACVLTKGDIFKYEHKEHDWEVNLTKKDFDVVWKTQWNPSGYSDYALGTCCDENYCYVVGYTYDEGDGDVTGNSVLIAKVDKKTGNVVDYIKYEPYDNSVDDDGDILFDCVIVGNYLYAVGRTEAFGNYGRHIVKVDLTDFTKVAEYNYNYQADYDDHWWTIDSDGNYLYVGGIYYDSSDYYFIVQKLDLDGNVLATYTVDAEGIFGCRSGSVADNGDEHLFTIRYYNGSLYVGGYYRCKGDWGGDGNKDDEDYRTVIIKLNASDLSQETYHVKDWSTQTWEGNQYEYIFGIDIDDSGIYAVGHYYDSSKNRAFLLKLDHNLNEAGYTTWLSEEGNNAYAYKVKVTDKYVITAGSEYDGTYWHQTIRAFNKDLSPKLEERLDTGDYHSYFGLGKMAYKKPYIYIAGNDGASGNSECTIYKIRIFSGTLGVNNLKVIISNPNDYNLTDYQVRIDLSGYANATYFKVCADSSCNQVLDFCYEQPNGGCDTTVSNIIWVKVNLTANSSTTIYIFKDTVNNAVNGSEVFNLYWDADMGLSYWQALDEYTQLSIADCDLGKCLFVKSTATTTYKPAYAKYNLGIPKGNYTIDALVYSFSRDTNIGFHDGTNWFAGGYNPGDSDYTLGIWTSSGGYSDGDTSNVIPANKWVKLIVKYKDGVVTVIAPEYGKEHQASYSLSGNTFYVFIRPFGADSSVAYYRYFKVRKYADKEPTIAIQPLNIAFVINNKDVGFGQNIVPATDGEFSCSLRLPKNCSSLDIESDSRQIYSGSYTRDNEITFELVNPSYLNIICDDVLLKATFRGYWYLFNLTEIKNHIPIDSDSDTNVRFNCVKCAVYKTGSYEYAVNNSATLYITVEHNHTYTSASPTIYKTEKINFTNLTQLKPYYHIFLKDELNPDQDWNITALDTKFTVKCSGGLYEENVTASGWTNKWFALAEFPEYLKVTVAGTYSRVMIPLTNFENITFYIPDFSQEGVIPHSVTIFSPDFNPNDFIEVLKPTSIGSLLISRAHPGGENSFSVYLVREQEYCLRVRRGDLVHYIGCITPTSDFTWTVSLPFGVPPLSVLKRIESYFEKVNESGDLVTVRAIMKPLEGVEDWMRIKIYKCGENTPLETFYVENATSLSGDIILNTSEIRCIYGVFEAPGFHSFKSFVILKGGSTEIPESAASIFVVFLALILLGMGIISQTGLLAAVGGGFIILTDALPSITLHPLAVALGWFLVFVGLIHYMLYKFRR